MEQRKQVKEIQMLAAIHKYLFGEIYEFAGEVRTINMAKVNFRFASVMYLQVVIENVEKMPQSIFEQIIEKYVEMNTMGSIILEQWRKCSQDI